MVFKCKMCGGDLTPKEGSNIGVCSYCKSTMTLPNLENEKIVNLYNRANDLRLSNRFDESKEIYEKILLINNNEIEAHWGILLCKYGIEYVDDPKTKKKIPTCHRTIDTSILIDPDFKFIKKEAYGEALELYVEEAKAIDKIQTNILNISKKEKPYDVFICYKETDETGERTKDSVIAEDIYDKLTESGLKVFFAKITLESKLGTEYEPYIYSALKSAKVMLVVGTKEEYFNAIWVKNEWSRFLEMMKHNKGKSLIPVYSEIDAYKLPEEFAMLQAQNMDKIGAIQDLVRGTKKIVQEYTEEKNQDEAEINNDVKKIGNGEYEVTVVKESLPIWYKLLTVGIMIFGLLFIKEIFNITSIFDNRILDIRNFIIIYKDFLPLVFFILFIVSMFISLILPFINSDIYKSKKYFLASGLIFLYLYNITLIKSGYKISNIAIIWTILFIILFIVYWIMKPMWQINISSKSIMNEDRMKEQVRKNKNIKNNWNNKLIVKINKKFLATVIILAIIITIPYIKYMNPNSQKSNKLNPNINQVIIYKSQSIVPYIGTNCAISKVDIGEVYNILNIEESDKEKYIKIENNLGITGYIKNDYIKINCVQDDDECNKNYTQTNERNEKENQLKILTEYLEIYSNPLETNNYNSKGKVFKGEIYTILDSTKIENLNNKTTISYQIKTSNGIKGWITSIEENTNKIEILKKQN